jgi:gamma-glutamylcyclotransferase (GGCT)/AIG2-like uncharacterized protein YtfP
MEDSLKFIYQNYSKAASFRDYWYAFENYLDMQFPHSEEGDTFVKRLRRFEKYLQSVQVHDMFLSRIFALDEAKSLAELQPQISRENKPDTSAHVQFASDYSRYLRREKPKQPIYRLLNLLYTIRCNDQHGQKILPEEWEEIRRRNELIFSLTTPLLAELDELIITSFVSSGVFAYGTLQQIETSKQFPFTIQMLLGIKIKGHLYDLGLYPGWRYDTWGWVHGISLSAPPRFRAEFIEYCDKLEGASFERRLVIAYSENDEHLAWAYHYKGETNISQRVQDGVWKGLKERQITKPLAS